DVAKALGMTKGNIYRYAKGKKDLYEKTVAWALSRWQGQVAGAVAAEMDPRRCFIVLAKSAVRYLSTDDRLRRLLARDPDIFPMFADHDPYGAINAASVAMIRRVLEEGMEAGAFRPVDPPATAEAFFSVYKMLIIRAYIRAEEAEMWTAFNAILELLTQGLYRKPETGEEPPCPEKSST
ncbi:MAG: TetR/AcrR family transcriptional regulator, partial [Proteobacteria bacterium]|nr:TetR/AcrR family transcriptional regulator [Pseudomonadota bacterium]